MGELLDQRLGKDETKINGEVPAERKVVTGTGTERNKEIVKEYGPVKPPLKDDHNLLLKIFLGVVGIVIVSWVMFLKGQALVIPFFWIAVIVYSVACIKNITAKEKGVKETLSTLDERYMYTGGYYWRWFFFQRFHLFTTEPVIINIPEQEVLTAKKTELVDGEEEVYAGANIKVDAVLYFFWPKTPEGLCEAVRKAPSPTNKEKIYNWIEPSLSSTIMAVAGDHSWRTVRMNERFYVEALQKEVRDNKEGPISQAGITDFSIENKKVTLPDDLEKLITAEQKAALEKKAGIIKAELNEIELVAEGRGKAKALELLLEIMEKYSEVAKLWTQKEMAQGQASTIFYEIPSGLKGGDEIAQKIASLLKVMPESQRALFEAEFAKITKNK